MTEDNPTTFINTSKSPNEISQQLLPPPWTQSSGFDDKTVNEAFATLREALELVSMVSQWIGRIAATSCYESADWWPWTLHVSFVIGFPLLPRCNWFAIMVFVGVHQFVVLQNWSLEAVWRVLELWYFDVQLLGGLVLHKERLAEMKTGELPLPPTSTKSWYNRIR